MSVDAAIVLLSALALGNYLISRSVLYPPLCFCVMWLLTLGLYNLDLTPVDTIHPETIWIIGVGAITFSVGGLLALHLPRNLFTAQFIVTRFPPRNNIVKPAVTLFLLAGFAIIVRNLLALAATGFGTTILQRARTGEADTNPLGTYFLLWSIYAATLFLLERRDKYFWLMAGIAFTGGILGTGRLEIFLLVGSLTCAHLMVTGRHTLRVAFGFARLPIIGFLILFFVLFFTNKDTSVFEASGVGELLIIFLVGYTVGPTAALDVFLQHPSNYPEAPHHTFRFFLGIATHLHFANYIAPGPELHIDVPFPTNVYTVYRTYIQDFGLYGALAAMAIIGLLHTMLYRKARTGSKLGIYFFAATFFQVLMVIFSDEYASFGTYIDLFLFAAIYTYLRSLPLRILPRLRMGYGVPGNTAAARFQE